jgi:prepilin signal peptidase PulO-like enzyme (type II secretory pathway)
VTRAEGKRDGILPTAGLVLIAAAGGCAIVLLLVRSGFDRIALLPIVGMLIGAAIFDLRSQRIPDWITLPGLGWAIGLSLLPSLWRPFDAMLGALVSGGLLLIIAAMSRGAVGGGDIKLMAVIGAILGPQLGLLVLFAAHLCAALVLLPRLCMGAWRRREPVPFGPFLVFAGIMVLALAR